MAQIFENFPYESVGQMLEVESDVFESHITVLQQGNLYVLRNLLIMEYAQAVRLKEGLLIAEEHEQYPEKRDLLTRHINDVYTGLIALEGRKLAVEKVMRSRGYMVSD